MIRGQLSKAHDTWRRVIPVEHATWPLTLTDWRLKTDRTNPQELQFGIRNRRRRRRMMMNVLGLSLLVTSLAAAGIFSPNPNPETQQKLGANTIVKEGHRVVVVEYDQDGYQNTKISISPEPSTHHHVDNENDNDMLHSAKDKIKEAASVLPNLGQGISQDTHDAAFLHAPKELICDTYGKCKHKIADAMEKTKDMAQEAIHKKKDMISANKEAARQVGDTLAGKAKEAQEYTKENVEAVKDHLVNNVSADARGVKHAMKRLGFVETPMRVANLLGFATAYGMCMWVTFISSYVLSRVMPRQQFAVVQSKIYPVYFRAMAYSVAIALFGHVLGHTNTLFHNKAQMLQAYNLLASLFTLFVNSFYLEPRATKLMFERIKIEKEEGRGREDMSSGERSRTTGEDEDAGRARIMKLNDKLKKLNSYSSVLNILNLMSLTWHLVYLAQRLHHTC
ncbi:hypothetical protein RJT34_31398 [Clitoria ternatea]|uniref:TMEM205-like domain-containing protein n=1 Tax=Clitoria ternatea TaxID=43366 RepID=A0AAN9I8C6_CLITE